MLWLPLVLALLLLSAIGSAIGFAWTLVLAPSLT